MEPGGNDSFCFPSSGLSSVQGLNPHTGSKSEAQEWSQFRKPQLSPNALRPSPPPCDKEACCCGRPPTGHSARPALCQSHCKDTEGQTVWSSALTKRRVSDTKQKCRKERLECESHQRCHVLLGFLEMWLQLPSVLLFLLNVGRRCSLGDLPALASPPSWQHFP